MIKNNNIKFILLLLSFCLTAVTVSAQKKIFELPKEVVSDEVVRKPEDIEKEKAEKAKIAEERRKRAAERAALDNVSDENDTQVQEPQKTPSGEKDLPAVDQATEPVTPAAAKPKVDKNDDLPVDPSEQIEAVTEPAPVNATTTPASTKIRPAQVKEAEPAASMSKDYETVKIPGRNLDDEAQSTGKKDYGSVKMAPRPSLDSLRKRGLPIPINAVNRQEMAGAAGGDISSIMLSLGTKKGTTPDSLFFFMERTPCKTRPCASYRIEIYFSGNVIYTGYNGVQLKGAYAATLSKQVLKNIFEMAKDAKFYNLQDAYIDGNTETAKDKQITNVLMKVKGKVKLVKDGQTNTPSELVFIEKYVDDALSNVEWKIVSPKKPL